jgi:hypothetical protein
MKRFLLVLACAVVTAVVPVRADESPETVLEYVRGLRDTKGYADLALQYLEMLQKNPPPALKSVLSMELAKTRIALAKGKEPAQRLALLKAARDEMDAFVKANPDRPEAAKARLELARLASQQGKAMLSKALRSDDEKAQIEEAHKAELQFTDAGHELDGAVKLLGALAAKYKDAKTDEEKQRKAELEQDYLDARFERGLNLMELADTYIDTAREDINRKKAEAVDSAKKIFEDTVQVDAENPTCAIAAAWLIRCNQVGQDPLKAKAWFNAVLKIKDNPGAVAARRLAYYFHLQGIMTDATSKLKPDQKLLAVQQEAEAWNKRFPGAKLNTHEGQGVQFELASALYKQAASNKAQKSPKVANLYDRAQKIFAALAESDSDFSQKANDLNLRISFMRMGTDTPIDKLKDFDECYLKAHHEMFLMKQVAAKLANAPPAQTKKLEEDRKKHLKNVAQAFGRALLLANAKTSPLKIDEARFFLTTVYLLTGDPYRAAISGEALARTQPPRKRSATAAGIALEAYASVFARDNSDGNRRRLMEMAEFILKERSKVWQGEPVTPVAHYQLAMAYKRDDRFKDAIDQLTALTPEFPGYTFAQSQLVFIALDAQKKAATDAEKKTYLDMALSALKRIPKLPAATDPTSAALFFYSQAEYPKWLYAEAAKDLKAGKLQDADIKYGQMEKSVGQLRDQLGKPNVKLEPANFEKIGFLLQILEKYARLGMADTQYRAGKYDKVLAPDQTGKTVAEVKKLGEKPGPIALRDYQVTGDVLGLALRAYVQLGKMPEAQEVLKLIERVKGTEGEFSDPTAVLRALVQELQTQVAALKKAGDSKRLNETVVNFSAFVGELAKNPGKKKMEPADYFFLGRCYASLEKYKEAADIYAKIEAPKALSKKEKLTEDEERQVQTYWYAQMEYARQLRQIGGENKKANLAMAYKTLMRLKNHPNARGGPDADMEIFKIYEDNEDYGRAITEWGKFLSSMQKSPKKDEPKMKEMYFDGYYHYILSTYRYSQTDKARAMKKDKTMARRAADFIVRLERLGGDGWDIAGQRLQELLEREPPLREAYDELKKSAK